jgi:hypothetical protein
MRLLQIRARTNEDADCLVRELAVYSPRRLKRSVLFELEERSQTDLLAMLSAVETCLSANDIRSRAHRARRAEVHDGRVRPQS